jgi:RNA polymerase sigma-70 factor (ECF subfamily)
MEQEGAEIARGLRQRDPDLLDRLIEQYQHRLLRYLISLAGERQTAEDLFQETWLRVLEHGRQYNGRTKFVTWLLTIARNLAIDHFRRKKPASLEGLMESEEHPREFPSAEPSAYEVVLRGEESDRLLAAMNRLPAEQREAIALRFQEGMSLEEIAQVTHAPLSTVKSRLYRGLEALCPMAAALRGGKPGSNMGSSERSKS